VKRIVKGNFAGKWNLTPLSWKKQGVFLHYFAFKSEYPLPLLAGYDNLYCMYELRAHIVVDPEIRFGKPCIKGTRITVGDILQWLSGGMTEQEIIADYPELQNIHIRAALAFAAERDAMTKVVAHETVA